MSYGPPPGYGPRFDPSDPLVSNDYSGWWQRVIAVIRRGWRILLLLQLVVQVPLVVLLIPGLVWLFRFTADLPAGEAAGSAPEFRDVVPGLLFLLPGALVGWLGYTVLQLATARAVVAVATGRPTTVRAELAAGARRLLPYVGWALLAVPIALLALVLCVLPIVYVGAVLVLLQAVVMFERGSGIGRCFQLFNHDVGAAAGRIATAWAVTLGMGLTLTVVSALVQAVAPGAQAGTFDLASAVVGVVLNVAYTAVTVLLVQPMVVLTYADLRARRDGLTAGHLLAEAYR